MVFERKKRRKNEKGFTLIEMVAVISIIGFLLAIIIPDLIKVREDAMKESCSGSLRGVQSALELYFTRYKTYPQTNDGLTLLIKEGYLPEGGDLDPWTRSFQYQPMARGETSASGGTADNYLLCSMGPDGRRATEDDIECPINPARHSFKEMGTTGGAAGQ